MKTYVHFCLCFVLLSAVGGCAARTISISSPNYVKMENDYFYFSVTPLSANERHCGFRVILKNKTTNPIFIDWNKTYYIENNERKGGFIFDDINFDNRNDPKRLEKVRGWDLFIKTVWPSILANGDQNQWTQMPMEPGIHGVEVAVVIDGRMVVERLVLQISNLEK